jgi:uncharacterized peroxidase-related enzyme
MSFVGKVSEAEACPELRVLYQQIRDNYGFLPNYFQALGRAPEVIERDRALAAVLLRDGVLPAVLKEQIMVVVSGINSSSYCIAAHMELLRKFGVEKALGRKLATDYANAPVGAKEKALFRFADKLTRSPSDIERADADAVLEAGWNETALLETVLTVAWAGFVNRVAFGLGLFADF